MTRHRGNVPALEPIRICPLCRRAMQRRRHPGGELEKLVDFDKRKSCGHECPGKPKPKPRQRPDDPIAKMVGERIRDLRRAHGWSQAELAHRIGTHRPIVSRVERGVHKQSVRTLTEYATALGVPVWAITNVMDGAPFARPGAEPRQEGESDERACA